MTNMFKSSMLILCICLLSCFDSLAQQNESLSTEANYAIVIHGGAGNIVRDRINGDREKEYLLALEEALSIGENILIKGGTSLEAVEATIVNMENCPLFNAGKGAVFTNEEKNELDASVMTGHDQNAGAVGAVTNIKNPIKAAIAVMNNSKHVMMVRKGAEDFAKAQKLEIVDPSYFRTQKRLDAIKKIKAKEASQGLTKHESQDWKYGTVGCVALDKLGNITAGTSTGGMTNKRYNRIGDSPIIGAGTYADNNTCGISSTGHGEYFIRYAVAHDIAARMEYKGISLQAAAEEVVLDKLVEKGGSGGIIGLDQKGNISMVFNSNGMFRACSKNGTREVKIFKEQ